MSSEASLVFFGIRFEISEDEIPNVENRSHPLVKQGRSVGLQFYWEDFGTDEPKYLGFIGRRVAILGIENDAEVDLDDAMLREIIRGVVEKLAAAGIQQTPRLYMQWMPPK